MLEIKKAGIKDIELIQQLAHAIWPDAYGKIISPGQLSYMLNLIYSKDALTNQVENLHHQFIIVRENDHAVGFASYSPKHSGDATIYRLHKLYVLPNQQGKGTGKFLLNFIKEEIKQTGAKIIELNVNRHNKALHFYNKIGFSIAREEDIDIGSGYFMNDFVMELRIMNYEL
ncbi:MAG: GNAT family N-acetyltransferase [Ferruginibacter sp.]